MLAEQCALFDARALIRTNMLKIEFSVSLQSYSTNLSRLTVMSYTRKSQQVKKD